MIERRDRKRKTWFTAGALLLVLAVAASLAFSWTSSPNPDDPKELLRRARESESSAAVKSTGKSITAKGVSSSGAPVEARFHQFKEKGGRGGYVMSLPTPLKEGEKTTLALPGGGQMVIERPRDGEAPKYSPSIAKNRSDR
jgi:hypothetical protein